MQLEIKSKRQPVIRIMAGASCRLARQGRQIGWKSMLFQPISSPATTRFAWQAQGVPRRRCGRGGL